MGLEERAGAGTATKQECDRQLAELLGYVARRGWQTSGEYVDVGASWLQLARLMAESKRRQMDCVLVWRLDRWGRNLAHCLAGIEELRKGGIGWIAVSQGIDTDSGAVRAFISALLEFVSEAKRESVKAGMRAATRRGAEVGRPKRVFDRSKVAEMHQAGDSARAIAKKLGVGQGTVQRLLSGPKG